MNCGYERRPWILRRALLGVVPLVLLALLLPAAPASAIVSFSDPNTLSEEDAREGPQVVVDSSDRATVVWSSFDGANWRVKAVRVAANGTPGPIKTLSATGEDTDSPQVAIDGSDRPTVVWSRSDGTNSRIQAVRIGPLGNPGPVKTLSGAGQDADFPQVVVDDSDRATVVWSRSDSSNDRIQSVRLGAAQGNPGPIKTLSAAGEDAGGLRVVVDGSGRATVVWSRSDGSNKRIQALRIAENGTPGPIRTLSAAGQDARYPDVAVDGIGRATVAWSRSDGSVYRVQSVRLGAAEGNPGPLKALSGAESDEDARVEGVAVDGQGRAYVIWTDLVVHTFAIRIAADGTPGKPEGWGEVDMKGFQLVVDRTDRPWIAWNTEYGSADLTRLAAEGTPVEVFGAKWEPRSGELGAARVAFDSSNRPVVAFAGDAWSDGIERILWVRGEITYPETTITSGPAGPTNDDSPSFGFSTTAPGSSFECRLDGGAWSACSSPRSYSNLADGSRSFEVRAIDAETDVDPTPATRGFTVDTFVNGFASADGAQKQKGKKIFVQAKVTAGENLDTEASGKVKVGKKSYALKPASKSVSSGKNKNLKLKPKKSKDAKKIAKALKQGKKAKAKLTMKLTDEAGNKKSEMLSVKLKR